jgi:hypothetical protein
MRAGLAVLALRGGRGPATVAGAWRARRCARPSYPPNRDCSAMPFAT